MWFIICLIISFIVIGLGIWVLFELQKEDPKEKDRMNFGRLLRNIFFVIGFSILFIWGGILSIAHVPAGSVALINTFGIVDDQTLSSGISLINPFSSIHCYSIKTQEQKEINISVPSKEGLTIVLEVSLLYSVNPDKIIPLYKTVGEDYLNILLLPQFRSIIRNVTALYEASALYTEGRSLIENIIREQLQNILIERGILIEAVLIRNIVLPEQLQNAINAKLAADQEQQKMDFVLAKEQKEAERKEIEAGGVAKFQSIVAQGIDNNLLKWKGIEATENLAKSPNSKIIVIGSGKDGLPIILNGQ